jgi:guanyl-specific ribonuclease Sa
MTGSDRSSLSRVSQVVTVVSYGERDSGMRRVVTGSDSDRASVEQCLREIKIVM